jgi:membrane-bound metal-dependent hydrolase YbcI (DUF457 family)
MANYKAHFSAGILLGIFGAVLSLIFWQENQYSLAFLVVFFLSFGAILPDIDSDESVPFRVVFWFLAVFVGTFIFVFSEELEIFELSKKLLASLGAVLFFRFVVGRIFMRFTHHRGMFHSLPTALIFGLICFYFLEIFSENVEKNLILSFSLFVGYVSHLLLDEIYAGVNFSGIFIQPKKSLGSALKLFSHSQKANIIAYGILIFLLFSLWTEINNDIVKGFFEKIGNGVDSEKMK